MRVPALRSSAPDDASHRRESAAPRPGHERDLLSRYVAQSGSMSYNQT